MNSDVMMGVDRGLGSREVQIFNNCAVLCLCLHLLNTFIFPRNSNSYYMKNFME